MNQLIVSGNTQTIAGVMACCGSTAAQYYGRNWRGLVLALREDDRQATFYHAEGIVLEAIPEEGEIHPQRATVDEDDYRAIFTTPGGVTFTVAKSIDSGNLVVVVEFGRDSTFLARQMLASIAMSEPTYVVIVDDEATTAGLALAASLVKANEKGRMMASTTRPDNFSRSFVFTS